MQFSCSLFTVILAGAPLFVGGCASVTVEDGQAHPSSQRVDRHGGGIARPTQFVVTPFVVQPGRAKENPARKHPGQLAQESQQLLTGYLVEELNKLGLPASAGVPIASGRGSGAVWIVSGEITRVAEGNRLLRMGIGLGAGGTKMETAVNVESGGTSVLNFRTTGGSNAMPGAATTPIPFSGLPAALMNAKDGVTADAARTARMIAARIANDLAERGWYNGPRPAVKMARAR